MARALGIDDSISTCDCCGKTGLKFTVAMQLDSGDVVHYGSTCAGRNTGKSSPQIRAEITAEYARKRAAEFVRVESDAELSKRREIAAKFGLKPYEVFA